ncbi:hypothetical protein [Acinetobacter gerneri]|uniref:Uncharacterized protein n=2 Tax=Acinetobacter gerneri TaxID=202952 RepID=N8ZJ42_9GAMM|nr:hypothetical protein [Acinetobacter gerneri]ENV33779.1 hypothetical protein F960_02163 [Acinetobacter gerneri DSM 14967 = CIP 107464 = MTCC 9824]
MDIQEKIKDGFKRIIVLSGLLATPIMSFAYDGKLQQLNDAELSEVNGQALLSLSYIDPKDSANLMQGKGIGFYKLGLEAELELNANIKKLQLGCGGVNGANGCDIDISNLALSGAPSSYDSNGNPVYANSRASTSAQIKNPFIQFAIKNPNSASTRTVQGIQLSAEAINGMLTSGIDNTSNPQDGIRSLSGYMKIAPTSGVAKTASAVFGNNSSQILSGNLIINTIWNNDRSFVSQPDQSEGLTIPSMNVPFLVPEITINGVRQSQAVVNNIAATVPSIKLDRNSGSMQVKLDRPLLWVQGAKFYMDSGSSIDNLKMNITFEQSLNMIHNIPLQGTGAYLSLQSEDIKWPGANADDVAKKGWWLSFKDPINIGQLNPSNPVDISGVLPQVASKVSDVLTANPIYIDLGSAIGSAFGLPIYKNVGSIDLSNSGAASLTLKNQILQNQNVIPNCYGGLKFC